MVEYRAQENASFDLGVGDLDTISDLLEIGAQVKEKLGLMASPIQHIAGSKIYIGSIIGNLSLNNTRIIIRPKVPHNAADPAAAVKALYERTLKCSMRNLCSTVYFARSSMVSSDELFTDTLASLLISSLNVALRGGRIMQYEEKTAKCRAVKGRILMGKQLAQPILDEKTWCRFHRMSDRNIYNQLLHWACQYLSAGVHNFDLKRKLLFLSKEFIHQSDLLSVHAVKNIRLTRQYAEYLDALSIAQNLFLGVGGQKESGHAGKQICGYVIHMEKAFENIVSYFSAAVALTLGFSHKGQARIRFATANGNDDDYDIRPDDLISDGTKNLIMDAKYKILSSDGRFKRKPSRDDFYQMISSCIAYNSPEAILVYPLTAKFPQQKWDTVQAVNGKKISVSAIGVDLFGSDATMVEVITQALRGSYLCEEISQ